ncbi:MAG: hypothetical protein HF976_05935 [ANME-2 cluster archaeon]|nr:hypothetical protein [ANME-2 cluster archaeon]MBC2700940.1 hypothetical protein [ANME-2 cluster archaeon]MBC2709076.1 hypothetical protein [ANME-2 cluster archaeon]MBC2747417.1 hypothetical protein [ANME-2 cluster archaeon]MBC2762267.1 hypothetical protein [ANME-2 cluster archaeon]
MEINITKDWENTLLDRKEITFNISHTGATPSRDEIKNKLVAQLNSRHELVIVNKIRTEYGTQSTTGYAKIYSDVDRANEIENKYILKRNELKPIEETEKQAEEEPAEPPEESTGEEADAEEPIVSAEEVGEEEPAESPEESTGEEAVAEEPIAEEAASEEPTEEEPVE